LVDIAEALTEVEVEAWLGWIGMYEEATEADVIFADHTVELDERGREGEQRHDGCH
jgi:hypothetical protein